MKEIVVFASICFISFLYIYVLDGKKTKQTKENYKEEVDNTLKRLEKNVANINKRVNKQEQSGCI